MSNFNQRNLTALLFDEIPFRKVGEPIGSFRKAKNDLYTKLRNEGFEYSISEHKEYRALSSKSKQEINKAFESAYTYSIENNIHCWCSPLIVLKNRYDEIFKTYRTHFVDANEEDFILALAEYFQEGYNPFYYRHLYEINRANIDLSIQKKRNYLTGLLSKLGYNVPLELKKAETLEIDTLIKKKNNQGNQKNDVKLDLQALKSEISKTELTELIWALYLAGIFPDQSQKEVFEKFGQICGLTLDHESIKKNIKRRKEESSFILKLKRQLFKEVGYSQDYDE